jgi:hypothetical protein
MRYLPIIKNQFLMGLIAWLGRTPKKYGILSTDGLPIIPLITKMN